VLAAADITRRMSVHLLAQSVMTKVLPSGVILLLLSKPLQHRFDISVGIQVGQQGLVILEKLLGQRMLHS
jgi:hypothetical protein